jgi:hypothetical protein
MVGGGGVPAVTLPGSFLASAITSASDFAGNDGWVITTIGVEAISPTGAKSLFKS